MSSTYSPDLRLELVANGEQSGVWGTTTNNNLGTLIEQAIAKTSTTTLTSTVLWFVAANGVADTARCAAVDVAVDGSITAAFTAYIPPVPKLYIIKNSSAYTMTLRNATAVNSSTSAGGATVVIPTNKTVIVRSDGTNVYSQFDYINGSLQISNSLTVDGAVTVSGNGTIGSARLSATYSQPAGTTATFTVANTYAVSDVVYIASTSGGFSSGLYTITGATTANFTVTAPSVATSIAGNALVTNDTLTINSVVQPGVIIEGSSTLPALRVTQTGSGNSFEVDDSTNPDSTPFVIDNAGQIVTGTTASISGFSAGSVIPRIQEIGTDANGTALGLALFNSSTTQIGPSLELARSSSTSAIGTFTAVPAGALLGTIKFSAADGSQFQPVANIRGVAAGAVTSTSAPGYLSISTIPALSTTLIERLRFNSDGNIILGAGEETAATTGNTLRGPNGTGTDVVGTNFTIAAGNGTGTGGSGSIVLQTAPTGTTGTAQIAMVDRVTVLPSGFVYGKYATMGQGIVPSQSYYRLAADYVGANVNTNQSLFGKGVPLAASTTYAFEMVFNLYKTTGAASNNISLLFDIGAGTIADIAYSLTGVFKANPTTTITAPDVCIYSQVTTATQLCGSSTTPAVNLTAIVKGTFSVGTAGTWTPQYKLSAAPGGAYSTLAGSYVNVYPIGPSGAAINVGGWV